MEGGEAPAADRPVDGPRPWERLECEEVASYEIFRVNRIRCRSPRTGSVRTYHTLSMPDWVDVVAETEDGRLVMVEQYRHGAEQVVLEFPSGILEPGEDPAQAGLRELEEETGWRAAGAERIGGAEPNSALQDNCLHIVVATGCTPTGSRNQDEGEDVHTRLVDPAEIPDLITSGVISHALAVTTWYYYTHHKHWLRVGGREQDVERGAVE